ncbi:MAG: aldehyde dehydrogenase family protein [Candidatus Firestonebacteria bacterium]|nr:aldehyde dehydrogenase family protein [Candidatus Firestonebacteria bacterium]
MSANENAVSMVGALVERSKRAQKIFESASQEQVDELTARVAWAGVKPEFAKQLAETLVAESGLGFAPHKIMKIMTKIKGSLRDMKGKKSVGVVFEDKEAGIIKLAKPVGVIGGILPVTNGEATPFVKVLFALKTRNSIILAPHPKALKTCNMAVNAIRAVLKKQGWPEDLVIGMDPVSIDSSMELMKQCDLVIATGGAGLVKAAYASGTPSYGVGAGNSVCVVDETADLKDVADKIMRSKTFDYATSCSTENEVIIQEGVYDKLIKELEAAGGYLVKPEEKGKLQAAMWDAKTHALNRGVVAQSAAAIAKLAGINLPEGKSFLMVPETGVGDEFPFSREKLSVTMAVYKWKTFKDAIELVNKITTNCGAGHSCGIHTTNELRIKELALKVKVSRIMIRQPQCLGNSGAWTNGMPMTMTLGCGTWGGNISSSNITWEHMLNYTWVSYPIPSTQPTDEELFGTIMNEN